MLIHKPDDRADQILHIHRFFEIGPLYFPDLFQLLLLFRILRLVWIVSNSYSFSLRMIGPV